MQRIARYALIHYKSVHFSKMIRPLIYCTYVVYVPFLRVSKTATISPITPPRESVGPGNFAQSSALTHALTALQGMRHAPIK